MVIALLEMMRGQPGVSEPCAWVVQAVSFGGVPSLRVTPTGPTWVYKAYYVGGRGLVHPHLPPCPPGLALVSGLYAFFRNRTPPSPPPAINLVSNLNTQNRLKTEF